MTTTDRNHVLAAMRTIPEQAVVRPRQPVGSFVMETANLYEWVQQDRGMLVAAGLDWSMVESMPVHIGILRETESTWYRVRRTRKEAARKLRLCEPEAWTLRQDMVAWMRFAFRGRPELLLRVADISKGRTRAHLAQSLHELYVLGQRNPEPLKEVRFDFARLDKASMMAERLTRLHALRDGTMEAVSPKEVRDRAFTSARKVVEAVRAYGRLVFRDEPERAKGYFSEYKQRQRRASKLGAKGAEGIA